MSDSSCHPQLAYYAWQARLLPSLQHAGSTHQRPRLHGSQPGDGQCCNNLDHIMQDMVADSNKNKGAGHYALRSLQHINGNRTTCQTNILQTLLSWNKKSTTSCWMRWSTTAMKKPKNYSFPTTSRFSCVFNSSLAQCALHCAAASITCARESVFFQMAQSCACGCHTLLYSCSQQEACRRLQPCWMWPLQSGEPKQSQIVTYWLQQTGQRRIKENPCCGMWTLQLHHKHLIDVTTLSGSNYAYQNHSKVLANYKTRSKAICFTTGTPQVERLGEEPVVPMPWTWLRRYSYIDGKDTYHHRRSWIFQLPYLVLTILRSSLWIAGSEYYHRVDYHSHTTGCLTTAVSGATTMRALRPCWVITSDATTLKLPEQRSRTTNFQVCGRTVRFLLWASWEGAWNCRQLGSSGLPFWDGKSKATTAVCGSKQKEAGAMALRYDDYNQYVLTMARGRWRWGEDKQSRPYWQEVWLQSLWWWYSLSLQRDSTGIRQNTHFWGALVDSTGQQNLGNSHALSLTTHWCPGECPTNSYQPQKTLILSSPKKLFWPCKALIFLCPPPSRLSQTIFIRPCDLQVGLAFLTLKKSAERVVCHLRRPCTIVKRMRFLGQRCKASCGGVTWSCL